MPKQHEEDARVLERRLYSSKLAERRGKVVQMKYVHIKNMDLEGL